MIGVILRVFVFAQIVVSIVYGSKEDNLLAIYFILLAILSLLFAWDIEKDSK